MSRIPTRYSFYSGSIEQEVNEGNILNFERIKVMALSLLVGFSLTGAAPRCEGAAAEVDAISITQTHLFYGKVVVTATNNALRIDDSKGLGFVLVTKAPDWTVNVFRDKEKLILTESFNKFLDAGLVNEIILTRRESVARGDNNGEVREPFMGFSIADVRFPRPFKFLPLPKGSDTKIPLAVAAAYRTHGVDGFPLYETSLIHMDLVSGRVMRDRIQTDLSTSAISKVKVSGAIFDAPKGYTKAKSMPEVVSGPNSKEQTADLQDMLGP